MLSNITVRLKLSDFINTDYEESIMKMINKTHDDLSIVIFLHMWYDDDISPADLKSFLLRWEDKLHFKTKVQLGSRLTPDEFIFFDLLPTSIPKSKMHRFCYTYNNSNKMIDGLNELYNCVKFITSNKPNKKQKRNDYED
tara:strand:- start:10201 stop:10620 length:420 start_codon:yes stop_codon:yes gene_type:complete